MLEMIRERRSAEKKEERFDLFSSLLDAAEGEYGDARLSDQELVGEIIISPPGTVSRGISWI